MSGTIDRRGATLPDFLVKLLTMVGDEAPDLISWTGGKLYIHDPVALERKMSVYFRHSNFSSFQRQLNNFGFRKVEGKGKLAPCMYMHDDLVQARCPVFQLKGVCGGFTSFKRVVSGREGGGWSLFRF